MSGDRAALAGGGGTGEAVGASAAGLLISPGYYNGIAEIKGQCLVQMGESFHSALPCVGVALGLAPLERDLIFREVQTDSRGEFLFPNIASGKYRVKVWGEWYGLFSTGESAILVRKK